MCALSGCACEGGSGDSHGKMRSVSAVKSSTEAVVNGFGCSSQTQIRALGEGLIGGAQVQEPSLIGGYLQFLSKQFVGAVCQIVGLIRAQRSAGVFVQPLRF